MNKIEKHHFISKEIEQREQKISDYENEIKELKQEVKFLKKWDNELKKNVCDGCNGMGKIKNYYDFQDFNFQTCSTCNGAGLKS